MNRFCFGWCVLLLSMALTGCGGSSSQQGATPLSFASSGADYSRQVQEMYVAYYGRPADPGGQQYWANRVAEAGGNLSAIIQEFGTSQEALERFGGSPPIQAVRNLYFQMFGREPDASGLAYYTNGIEAGKFDLITVAADIFYGAAADSADGSTLRDKVNAAQSVTDQLSNANYGIYAGPVKARLASKWLEGASRPDHKPSTLIEQFQRPELECRQFAPTSDLNIQPVKSIEGLWSNWKNKSSILGVEDTIRYAESVSNLAAVAFERTDTALMRAIVNSLSNWATQGALKETRMCVDETGNQDSLCTQWTVPDGSDVSAGQTAGFVRAHTESLRRSYSLISKWSAQNMPAEHKSIREWFDFWESKIPRPREVYFGLGMGYYQWMIQAQLDRGETESARVLTQQLLDGIYPLLLEDGSLKDRTTRGNRAIWYHFTSINEVMVSLYLASKQYIPIDKAIEDRLHKSVEIFVRTLDDPKYILPWASKGFNNGGDGTQQEFFLGRPNDFSNWYDGFFAGSWIYLYTSWYPEREMSIKLRELVPINSAASASVDSDYMPLGCILY